MKSERTATQEKRATWFYIILGVAILIYAAIDKFFLPEIDNLGVAIPIGLMFIIISQSGRITQKLGRKGLVALLIFGIVLFLVGLVVYFLYR